MILTNCTTLRIFHRPRQETIHRNPTHPPKRFECFSSIILYPPFKNVELLRSVLSKFGIQRLLSEKEWNQMEEDTKRKKV